MKPLGVCSSDSTTADVIFSIWPGLMLHLSDYLTEGVSEEVGVQHIWLLFSAGLDMDAMEVSRGWLIFVVIKVIVILIIRLFPDF